MHYFPKDEKMLSVPEKKNKKRWIS